MFRMEIRDEMENSPIGPFMAKVMYLIDDENGISLKKVRRGREGDVFMYREGSFRLEVDVEYLIKGFNNVKENTWVVNVGYSIQNSLSKDRYNEVDINRGVGIAKNIRDALRCVVHSGGDSAKKVLVSFKHWKKAEGVLKEIIDGDML